MRMTAAALAALAFLPQISMAEGREVLDFGRLFTNDYFGDNDDRWRTGSYSYSIVTGPGWDGARPDFAGDILEYRLGMQIIAPSRLDGEGERDRLYVGAFTGGLHTHFAWGGGELSLGGDLYVTGEQTGISNLQEWAHESLGFRQPAVIVDEIGNNVFLGGVAEWAKQVVVNERVLARPFVEARVGPEDILRGGFDVFLGSVGPGDLLLRDETTGHLYRGIENPDVGMGVVIGADTAHVADSAWLPEDFGAMAKDTRYRARAGLHMQFAPDLTFFYGVTWLSPEFEGQPEGQTLGSLKLNFNF